VNVPLIAGVAVARLIVSLGGSLPMRYQKNETETIFFLPKPMDNGNFGTVTTLT